MSCYSHYWDEEMRPQRETAGSQELGRDVETGTRWGGGQGVKTSSASATPEETGRCPWLASIQAEDMSASYLPL